MHSVGKMFGLTFWENWYVIGENTEDDGLPPFKFIYYTGHTLQGNYEGMFVCVCSYLLRNKYFFFFTA